MSDSNKPLPFAQMFRIGIEDSQRLSIASSSKNGLKISSHSELQRGEGKKIKTPLMRCTSFGKSKCVLLDTGSEVTAVSSQLSNL